MDDVLYVVKEDVISRMNYLFAISHDEIMQSFVYCIFTLTRQGENSGERGDGSNAGRISRRCLYFRELLLRTQSCLTMCELSWLIFGEDFLFLLYPRGCPPCGRLLASSSWIFSCVMKTLMVTDRKDMGFTLISCSLQSGYPFQGYGSLTLLSSVRRLNSRGIP